jgi:hypothetical protein
MGEADVGLAALDLPHVGAVDLAGVGEGFLAEAALGT